MCRVTMPRVQMASREKKNDRKKNPVVFRGARVSTCSLGPFRDARIPRSLFDAPYRDSFFFPLFPVSFVRINVLTPSHPCARRTTPLPPARRRATFLALFSSRHSWPRARGGVEVVAALEGWGGWLGGRAGGGRSKHRQTRESERDGRPP